MLVDSMTRASVTMSTPRASADGRAVSWARSSGEATTWVMSRSPMVSAIRWAICCPSLERW
jgi:hypothetical protein